MNTAASCTGRQPGAPATYRAAGGRLQELHGPSARHRHVGIDQDHGRRPSSATAPTCIEATIERHCLPPGTWWLFVAANQFEGIPCDGTTIHDSLTLECIGQDCVALACGDAGHDCFTTGGPYCDDAACCKIVCAIDPFCCDVLWDGICVQEANDNCDVATIPNDECVDAVPAALGSTEFTTVGATTSPPPLPDLCERGFGPTFVNDIWFTFIAPASGAALLRWPAVGGDRRLA